MVTKLEKLPQSKIKIEVTIPVVDFEEYIDEAYKLLAREVKADGFRPGKAPRQVVKQRIDEGRALQEAADLALRDTYLKILDEHKLEPLGSPEIRVLKLAPGNEFIYEAELFVLPEITLADYKNISSKMLRQRSKDEIEVSEKELKDALHWLVNSRAKFVGVKRAAKKGDKLEIDFDVFQGGAPIENGRSQNHPLILGEGRFVPGFEEELEGMQEGEEKEFSLNFPDDYHEKSLAGKPAEFKVKIRSVLEKETPELNDAFAASLGQFKTLGELEKSVKRGLEQEKEAKAKEETRIAIISKIAEESRFETPDVLVEGELNKMVGEFKTEVAQMGLEFEKYLSGIKKSEDELKKEWRSKAEQRVKIGLVLRAIAEKEKIEPTEQEIEEEAGKILHSYGSAEQAGKNIDSARLREYTRNAVINEKTFQFLESVEK